MFTLKLYDRKGEELHEGDIIKISNGREIAFYSEVKYLPEQQIIAPFDIFSFHSFEKVDELPENAKELNENRFRCWFVPKQDDPDASYGEKYLMDWRQCEHLLEEKCYLITPEKSLSDYTMKELAEELQRRGSFSMEWFTEDIDAAVEDYFEDDPRLADNPLTKDEKKEILHGIIENHDFTIGINWDVLEEAIRIYLDKRQNNEKKRV